MDGLGGAVYLRAPQADVRRGSTGEAPRLRRVRRNALHARRRRQPGIHGIGARAGDEDVSKLRAVEAAAGSSDLLGALRRAAATDAVWLEQWRAAAARSLGGRFGPTVAKGGLRQAARRV